MLLRAARLRCPYCGGGPLFRRWLVTRRACPVCGLRLDRGEPDYYFGGMVVNFVTAETLVIAGAVVAALVTAPDVPWRLITWSLVAFVLVMPLVFYPFAKTLWLAVDLTFRPPVGGDFESETEGEGSRSAPGEASP